MDVLASRLWVLAGKLHPLVVHFPIALLAAAVAFEFIRRRRGRNDPSAPAVACSGLGLAGALVAALAGWSLAARGGAEDPWVHRWIGVAAAALALPAWVLGVVARGRPGPRALAWYRFSAAATAVAVLAAGHFGGELVWGKGYVVTALKEAVWGPEPAGKDGGAVAQAGASQAPVSHDPPPDFSRDVLPILSRRCYSCHGGGEHKSGLTLDQREGLLKGGESGEPAAVAGKGPTSLLVRLVRGEDPDRRMPPRGERLSPEQVRTLERWIDAGAPWGVAKPAEEKGAPWHWAYQPPTLPAVPGVKDAAWPAGDLDRLTLAKMEAAGVRPSPEADRATLLRRVSLDLTGLPPTPEEVDAFRADTAADAYERVVDRLLASPRYGERWARPWLDLARYADTNGYEKDGRRVMWPYRDWVIDAYNRDMPFDRFTVEQLAGDMLPEGRVSSLIATGFHRNTAINEEGGTDPEEFRVDAVMDRVNTTASVWLGTTLACAQCHDHKYDPLPQKDYYRFLAFFNQDAADAEVVNATATEKRAGGPMTPAPRLGDMAEFEARSRDARALEEEFAKRLESLLADGLTLERRVAAVADASWQSPPVRVAAATDGVTLAPGPEGSLVAGGANPEKSTYTVELTPEHAAAFTGLRVEVLPGGGTPSGHGGRSAHGNYVVSELVAEVIGPGGPRRIPLEAATATVWHTSEDEGDDWPAWLAIDGANSRGWTVHPEFDRPQALTVRFAAPVRLAAGEDLRVTLVQDWGQQHTLGRFRIALTTGAVGLAPPRHVAEILKKAASVRTEGEARRVRAFIAATDPELSPQRNARRETNARLAALTAARVFVMGKSPAARATHVFNRGSFLSPGEEVSPGVPGALAAACGEAPTPDRLGLALWLVSPKNPLTARVQVNRVWSLLFGHGLVETEEDFGTQGDPPTNRELLDYLAVRFVKGGWSQKRLLREIVLSRTYRQSSVVTKDQLEKDPANHLLARGPRHRVEAEMVRDIALAASGLLSPKMYGESVFPPQPPGIWTMIYSSDQWVESKGEDRYRRGLYTFARRTAPYPTFSTFDAPSREVVCTRRPRTNTPLQALTTMNDPQFIEAAGALAARMMREGGATAKDRAARGLRLALARGPDAAEVDRLVALFEAQRPVFEADAAAAEALLAQNPASRDGLPPAELAAWTVVANVILNLDETMTKS